MRPRNYMTKQFIYFAGVLFLMTAAILAVTAQENTSALNNTTMNITMNNTTLNVTMNQTQNASVVLPINATANETLIVAPGANLNETIPVQNVTVPAQNVTIPIQNMTIPAQNETVPVQNETVPAQNITVPENATLQEEPAIIAGATATISQPAVMQVGSSANSVFIIGSGLKSGEAIQIGGYGQTQIHELGSPAQPVRDLGNIAFNFDVI